MDILFLSDNFPPETNAPATRLQEHARRWVAAGHRVRVVTCAPNFPHGVLLEGYENRWRQRELCDGIEVLRVKTYIAANRGFFRRTLDHLSFGLSGLLGGLTGPAPDVVVATSPQFFAALGGWALAALRRRPFVFELRDLWPASISAVGAMREGRLLRLCERLELFLYRRAAAVVAVTEAFADDLARRGIDPAKVHVVTNGVDLSAYAPRPRGERSGPFTVGYLGTHGMAHALESALAAAELLRERSDVALRFVGEGAAKPALVEEARRRALPNVRFLPGVPKEAMPDAWAACDAALVHLKDAPLFATVIPSKLFEAMGMGLPIVFAGPEGEASRIVRAHGCGVVVPPEDPRALADALAALADDPERARALGAAGARAARAYDRDALAARMLAVLERCTGRGGGAERDDAARAA